MYSFSYLVDESLRDDIRELFIRCCIDEHQRVAGGAYSKKFILLGSAYTWMSGLAAEFLGVALSGHTTRVRYGRIKAVLTSAGPLDNSFAAKKIHSGLNLDEDTLNALHFILEHVRQGETVVAPFDIHSFIPAQIFTYAQTFFGGSISPDWVVLTRLKLKNIDKRMLRKVREELRVVYENKIIMILTRRDDIKPRRTILFMLIFEIFFIVLDIISLSKVNNFLKRCSKRKF
jgi:hypothetical protein